MMSALPNPTLADEPLAAGLADPVHGAQQAFRTLLRAQSYPGRVETLPGTLLAECPAGLQPASAALLLNLLDAETSVALALPRAEPLQRWLRFHCGVPARLPAAADFTVADARAAAALLLDALPLGSDELPQQGATLLIEVEGLEALPGDAAASLTEGQVLRLRGPGIAGQNRLAVAGLSPAFWRQRIALQGAFPRGLELLLVCGEQLVALPRSTRIELEG